MPDPELPRYDGGLSRPGDRIPQGRIARTAPYARLAARTAGEAVVLGLRGKLLGAQAAEFHIRTAERYAELLGRSRGALMKAGQMLSFTSAGPVVPSELQPIYQAALARLRDEVPPMAPELARAALEHELGRPLESVFSSFDAQPLAAASIGQVHAATLHDGREVAVKIQYPGVGAAIASDLENSELLATFLSLVFGMLPLRRLSFDLRGMAREMGLRILDELDYRLEASTQATLAERYRGHPFIHVPDVVEELCTGRVLTQELVRGRRWSEALLAEQSLRDRWGEAVFRFVYGAGARFGLLHADPHPGNYLFHDDGTVSCLDFGCVKRFGREHIMGMGSIGTECVYGNVLGTWHACVEAGFLPSTAPVTPEEAFAYWHGMLEMYWGEQPFTVTPEHADRCAAHRLAPRGPGANALRHSSPSPEYTVMARVEPGVVAMMGKLRATGYWQSIADELYNGFEPITELGLSEHAFLAERGMASHHV